MLDRGENASHVARVMRVGRSTLYRAVRRSAIWSYFDPVRLLE